MTKRVKVRQGITIYVKYLPKTASVLFSNAEQTYARHQ